MPTFYDVLDQHLKRYPNMTIQDVVKLLYQHIYGAHHDLTQEDYPRVLAYLNEELKTAIFYSETPDVEPIGHGYLRISLKCIETQKISAEELVSMFIWSSHVRSSNDEAFIHLLMTLKNHLSKVYDQDLIEHFIDGYLKEGIHAIHHSEYYRINYHPHYRVIHENVWKNKIK